MATITARTTPDAVEGAPGVVAAPRRWRLDLPSRPPADASEAIELGDLAQSLVPDADDPGHSVFAAVYAPWRPPAVPGRLVSDGGKLVRDDVPDVIRGQGLVPLMRPCRDLRERYMRLLDKVVEERDEYAEHVVEHDRGDLGELADLQEVVEALAFLDGYTMADVRRAQEEKRARRGGFREWLVWYGNVPASSRRV